MNRVVLPLITTDNELRHSVVLDALDLDIGVRRDGNSER